MKSLKIYKTFSINKQITAITILMQTQTKFSLRFNKIKAKHFFLWLSVL